MSTRRTLWFASLFLVALVGLASAATPKFTISGIGGLSMPNGDFADEQKFNASSGFTLGAGADMILNDHFAVGLDGSWSSNKHADEGKTIYFYDDTGTVLGSATYTKDKFTTSQIGIHGKLLFPSTGPLSAYGLLGVGMYNVTEKWEGTVTPSGGPSFADNDKQSTDGRAGFKIGVGGEYKVNPMWGIGAEADFNSISQDEEKVGVSTLSYITVRAVFTAHLGL